MTSLASVDDLGVLMKRVFTGDDEDQAAMVLAIVSSWARVASGQSWPDAPTGVPDDVRYVVLAASRRELTNPDRVISKTKGPFSVTYDKMPAGFFSKAEMAILGRFKGVSGGFRTLSTTKGDEATAASYGFLNWDDGAGDPFRAFAGIDAEFGDSI